MNNKEIAYQKNWNNYSQEEKDKIIEQYIVDFSKIPYERKLEERALYPFSNLNFMTGGMELGEMSVIAGETGCVDYQTEYFNGNRWVRISEYKKGDKVLQWNTNGKANLVYPQKYIKEPCEEFYYFENEYGINQMLSSEHRFVYLTPSGKLQEMLAQQLYERKFKQLKMNFNVITNFNFNGGSLLFTEERLKAMVEDVIDGVTPFYAEWYKCSPTQIKIICEMFKNIEGVRFITTYKEDNDCYEIYTLSPANADFIQFVFTLCGYNAYIRTERAKDNHNKILQIIKISPQTNVKFSNKTKYSIMKSKDGFKYCFDVNTGYLVLRRKGCIFITGNSGKSTLISQVVGQMLDDNDKVMCIYGESTLKKQANNTYRQYVPYRPNGYKYIVFEKNGKPTNVGQYFVDESGEKIVKEKTENKLFYYKTALGMTIPIIIDVIDYCRRKLGIKYFVIDNIMQLQTPNDDVKEVKDAIEYFRQYVIDYLVHICFIAHYRKGMELGQIRRKLEEICGTSAIPNKMATAMNIIRLDNIDRKSKQYKSLSAICSANDQPIDEIDENGKYRANAVIEVLKTRFNKLGFVSLGYNKMTNSYYEISKYKKENADKEPILHSNENDNKSNPFNDDLIPVEDPEILSIWDDKK